VKGITLSNEVGSELEARDIRHLLIIQFNIGKDQIPETITDRTGSHPMCICQLWEYDRKGKMK